jgi:hypothetical protein
VAEGGVVEAGRGPEAAREVVEEPRGERLREALGVGARAGARAAVRARAFGLAGGVVAAAAGVGDGLAAGGLGAAAELRHEPLSLDPRGGLGEGPDSLGDEGLGGGDGPAAFLQGSGHRPAEGVHVVKADPRAGRHVRGHVPRHPEVHDRQGVLPPAGEGGAVEHLAVGRHQRHVGRGEQGGEGLRGVGGGARNLGAPADEVEPGEAAAGEVLHEEPPDLPASDDHDVPPAEASCGAGRQLHRGRGRRGHAAPDPGLPPGPPAEGYGLGEGGPEERRERAGLLRVRPGAADLPEHLGLAEHSGLQPRTHPEEVLGRRVALAHVQVSPVEACPPSGEPLADGLGTGRRGLEVDLEAVAGGQGHEPPALGAREGVERDALRLRQRPALPASEGDGAAVEAYPPERAHSASSYASAIATCTSFMKAFTFRMRSTWSAAGCAWR